MIFIRKTQVRVPENIMTILRWTGIITAWLLYQGGSLHMFSKCEYSMSSKVPEKWRADQRRGKMRIDGIPSWHCCSWQLLVSAWRLTGLSKRLGQHSCVGYSSNCQKARQASRWEATSENCAFPKQRKELLQSMFTDWKKIGQVSLQFCSCWWSSHVNSILLAQLSALVSWTH